MSPSVQYKLIIQNSNSMILIALTPTHDHYLDTRLSQGDIGDYEFSKYHPIIVLMVGKIKKFEATFSVLRRTERRILAPLVVILIGV